MHVLMLVAAISNSRAEFKCITPPPERISLGGVVPTDQRVVGTRELRLGRRRAAEQRSVRGPVFVLRDM